MTGYCYDNNNKLVLLCYLSIIFVMSHYYCWLVPHFSFFLSVGDPGLPRWIKLSAFGIFYEPLFDNESYYHVFLYLYLLVIKPFKLSK